MENSSYRNASLIVHLGNAVNWWRNLQTSSYGLTSTQAEVIRYILKQEDHDITAGELMAELQLSQSTIAGVLMRLEKKGFILRERDPQDSRRSVIRPTPKGTELRESLVGTAVEVEEVLLRGMSEEEKREFEDLLQRALENMRSLRQSQEEQQGRNHHA